MQYDKQRLEELQANLDKLTKREKFFLKKLLQAKAWDKYFNQWLKERLFFTKKPFIIQEHI